MFLWRGAHLENQLYLSSTIIVSAYVPFGALCPVCVFLWQGDLSCADSVRLVKSTEGQVIGLLVRFNGYLCNLLNGSGLASFFHRRKKRKKLERKKQGWKNGKNWKKLKKSFEKLPKFKNKTTIVTYRLTYTLAIKYCKKTYM